MTEAPEAHSHASWVIFVMRSRRASTRSWLRIAALSPDAARRASALASWSRAMHSCKEWKRGAVASVMAR